MAPLARLAVALAAFALALSAPLAAAEPPAPSDAELTKYIAVQKALAGDTGRRDAICEAMSETAEKGSDDPSALGRKLDADPLFGPLLRRQGLAGRRFVELSAQVAGVLIGAAIADDADAQARRQGQPAKSRETLAASSPSAPPILARQAELTAALEAVGALCESGDDGDDESYDEG